MDTQTLLHSDYLDILFDARNKNYGGYELRRNYPKRVKKALVTVVLATSIASAFPVIAGMLDKDNIKPSVAFHKPADLIDPILPPLPPITPPPPTPPATSSVPEDVRTAAFADPVIAPDNTIPPEEILAPQEDLKDAQIGTQNKDGDATDTDLASLEQPKGPGGGGIGGNSGAGGAGLSNDAPFITVEQMPEFNGNIGDYLNSKLRYPESAVDAGRQGRVVVRFVVNEDGHITNSEVIKSVAADLDAEALRVVNAMPKWKPGKQNGRAVKVYFTLPISFTLQ